MSIAQDTVHDSIYKNDGLSKKVRNALSAVLFPIFERMAEIYRLTSQEKFEEVIKLEEEIESIKYKNADLLRQYDSVVKQAYREYGKTVFKHKNEQHIERESFLKGESSAEISQRKQMFDKMVDIVFDYYEQEGIQNKLSGYKPVIDKDIPLYSQKLKKETLTICSLIYRTYLISPEQRHKLQDDKKI